MRVDWPIHLLWAISELRQDAAPPPVGTGPLWSDAPRTQKANPNPFRTSTDRAEHTLVNPPEYG
jgi:hypothetical protein